MYTRLKLFSGFLPFYRCPDSIDDEIAFPCFLACFLACFFFLVFLWLIAALFSLSLSLCTSCYFFSSVGAHDLTLSIGGGWGIDSQICRV